MKKDKIVFNPRGILSAEETKDRMDSIKDVKLHVPAARSYVISIIKLNSSAASPNGKLDGKANAEVRLDVRSLVDILHAIKGDTYGDWDMVIGQLDKTDLNYDWVPLIRYSLLRYYDLNV